MMSAASKATYLARMLAQRHPGDTSTPPLLAELLVAIAELDRHHRLILVVRCHPLQCGQR